MPHPFEPVPILYAHFVESGAPSLLNSSDQTNFLVVSMVGGGGVGVVGTVGVVTSAIGGGAGVSFWAQKLTETIQIIKLNGSNLLDLCILIVEFMLL